MKEEHADRDCEHPDCAESRKDGSEIRILVADDHALVRRGISMILDCEEDLDVVGEAKDGTQALALATELRPDVVLADVTMPPPDGIELARLLRTLLPDTKTIIVSMHEDSTTVRAAFAAGAVAYVIKRATESELVTAIRAALAGQTYVDPQLSLTL